MAAPRVAGDLSFLPKDLRKKLLPFQREGIKFAMSRKGRCLIGDEMGLGKTLQAIAVAYHYQDEWPLLIVVPTALRYPWIEELEKWLPELQPNDVNLIASGTDIGNIPNCKISIVGYGLFRNDAKTLMEAITKQKFRVVIVDESHYLKNPKAARTKLVLPFIENAKRAILLTGTPALGRPSEINSIRPKMMGSWTQFAKRYCDAHWHYYGRTKRSWDTSGASNLEELHRKLTGSIMIRREKKNVLTQLPPKRRQKVPFELAESAEKKEIEQCWLAMRELWKPPPQNAEEVVNPKFQIQTLAGRMYVLTGKAKIGAVCEYIKLLLENQGLKFLVFAHHKEMMTALVQTVMAYQREHKTKLKYIRIDGDVPSLERMHLVRQFQTDEDTRVAILSILAAGTGLTFTAANQVVFAELHWTPGILEQCEDRAHRIGQINSIHVHYLVARSTMDEWIWSALSRKVSVLSSALNGRLQQLKMEEGGEEYADLLKQATAWLPSNQDDEEDDSFYFTQRQDKNQDIRSFFTPSGGSAGKKRKRAASGKGRSPKVSKLKSSVARATPKLTHQPVGSCDQSPIILDDSDDDLPVSEPIEAGVVSAADSAADLDRRSSLEDFVSSSRAKPIRRSNLTDVAEQGKDNSNKACSEAEQTGSRDVAGEINPARKSVIPSGTEEDLPEMTSIIRRRPRKRKSTNLKSDSSAHGPSSSNDLRTASSYIPHPVTTEVTTPSPRRLQQQGSVSVTPTCSQGTRGESSTSVDTRSPVGGGNKQLRHVDTQKDVLGWNCSACTFENHGALPFCEMCNTPKKNVTTRSGARVLKQCNTDRVNVTSRESTPSTSKDENAGVQKSCVDESAPSSSDEIVSDATAQDDATAHTDDASTRIDDASTNTDIASTDTDDVTVADDNESDDLTIEPASPMSIGSESSDVILDPDSPCSSDDDGMKDTKLSSIDGQNGGKTVICSELENQSHGTNFQTTVTNVSSGNQSKSTTTSVAVGNHLHSGNEGQFKSAENKVDNATPSKIEDKSGKGLSTDQPPSSEESEVIIKPATFKIRRKRSRSRSRHTTGPSPEGDRQGKRTSSSDVAVTTEAMVPSGDSNIQNKDTPIKFLAVSSSATPPSNVFSPCKSPVNDVTSDGSTSCNLSTPTLNATPCDASNTACQETLMFGEDIDSFTDSEMVDQLDRFEMGLVEEQGTTPSKEAGDHPISDSDGDSDDETMEPIQVYEALLFCASKYTDRIYLYDQDKMPLHYYFYDLDVQHRDLDALPRILHHPDNLLLTRRFVREWYSLEPPLGHYVVSLGKALYPACYADQNDILVRCVRDVTILSDVKKKQLRKSGYIFDSPIQAHEALKKGRPYEMCKKRFLTKEDLAKSALEKAKDVGGTVRIISKPSTAPKKGVNSSKTSTSKQQAINNIPSTGVGATNQKLTLDVQAAKKSSPSGISSNLRDSSNQFGTESDIPGTSSGASVAVDSSSGSESTLNSDNPAIANRRTYFQVLDKDGNPLCLFCGQATLSEAESKHRGAAWDRRFCSEPCKEEHALRRKNSKFAREKLLEAEHGICQQCGLHAHDLFSQVRDMAKSQRKDFLKSTPYSKLSAQKLNDIIKMPYAGQFWHADHIVAVFEGGGLCSLDNLRTLCVMCHDKVTGQQNQQRRKQKKIQQQREAGFGDITKFLQS